MKKAILLAAVASLSSPAFASKARINALQDSVHLVDTQTVFRNPADVAILPDHVSIEWGGPSNTSSTGNAEGGFFRSWDEMKWGMYFGRKSPFTTTYRANPFTVQTGLTEPTSATSVFNFGSANAMTSDGAGVFQGQDNPLELFWAMKGDVNLGASLSYSDSGQTRAISTLPADATQLVESSQQSVGVRLGAAADVWDAYANIGLLSRAKTASRSSLGSLSTDTTADYKGEMGYKIGGSYVMDTLYFHGNYATDGAKVTQTNEGSDREENKRTVQVVTVGVINQNKFEGGEFFYGASVVQTNLKHDFTNVGNNAATDVSYKLSALRLPVVAGVEVDANAWLTLRGALSQDLPISYGKLDTTRGTAETSSSRSSNTANTAVTAGLGVKFGKMMFDGFLKASNSATNGGEFGFDDRFLSQASVTYLF